MKTFLLVVSFFVLSTLVVTWPLIIHPSTLIVDRFDGLLITWFLNWDIHALSGGLHGILNLFNANIFYPYSKTLAFSETMLPEAIMSAPLVIIFKEPLLAYNLNFLLGFILTGVSLFYLVRFLTKDTRVSLLVATLFTFSTIHLNYMAHLQLFNIWPIILAILFIIKKNYKLYIFFFIVSILTTALNLYFLLAIVSVFLIYEHRDILKVTISTGIAGMISFPFLLPYYLVSKGFHYTRPINDAIHFSLQFPDLANISNVNRLSTLLGPIDKTTPAFPGVTFTILMGILVFSLYQRYKSGQLFKVNNDFDKFKKIFLTVVAVSFVFALGPALHLRPDTVHIGPLPAFPLPYAVFYYLLPGFSGFRTPSRWILLTFLSLSITIGLILHKKIKATLIVFLIILILLEVRIPFKYATVPSINNFPPEQQWLAKNFANSPIIQFPIYNWDNSPQFGLETMREYYSTIHFHPMFNGFSGFSPKEWENKVRSLQKDFPSDSSIKYLQSIKVKLVLVPKSWENRMQPYKQFKLIERFPKTLIYKLVSK